MPPRRSEAELAINIKKATSPEESAPKRKHVRSCIVYTWDHKSSQSFWAGLKVQPILADEVQTFKALITVHKVLQEGHPITLKEAMANRGWIDSLNRGMAGEGMRGYGPLIKEYVYYLLAKLSFHKQHPEFNGTFEYEEYISLKAINDPNEGYETITDLMTLQDKIDQFQKLVFSHFRNVGNNECRISALVPLVTESYGIYKFITSMLRAMHSCWFLFLEFVHACNAADLAQLLATMMPWSRSVSDTTPNITVSSSSTTNARISATSPASSPSRSCLKTRPTYWPRTRMRRRFPLAPSRRLRSGRRRRHPRRPTSRTKSPNSGRARSIDKTGNTRNSSGY